MKRNDQRNLKWGLDRTRLFFVILIFLFLWIAGGGFSSEIGIAQEVPTSEAFDFEESEPMTLDSPVTDPPSDGATGETTADGAETGPPIDSTPAAEVSPSLDSPVSASSAGDEEKPAESGPFPSAVLLGIEPGKTTVTELANHPIFQQPVMMEKTGDYDVWAYRLPDVPETPYVQLLIQNDRIVGVVIHLGQTRKIADARKAFDDVVRNLDPIVISDANGNYREIYPEKGFSFVLGKTNNGAASGPSDQVTQIVAEEVKPDYILYRAAENLKNVFKSSTLTKVREDAEKVIQRYPDNASAHWLLAETLRLTEDYGRAREEATHAVELDDRIPQYHFTLMKILKETGEYDDGFRYLEAVSSVCGQPPFFAAELSILRADFLMKKTGPDDDSAIREAQVAVSLLVTKVKQGTETEQIQAKELTGRAYLALARAIAHKTWDTAGEKEKSFLWVAAAAPLIDEAVKVNSGSLETILNLGLTATEIGLEIPTDPQMETWVTRMTAAGDETLAQCSDPLGQEAVRWRCGRALFNAFLAADAAGDRVKTKEYAEKALHYLEEYCEKNPDKVMALLGPIDYEFGLFFNEDEQDHEQAMKCLTRATSVILSSLKLDGSSEDGDHGIRLVNIGKAFWTDGQRDKGLELTQKGVDAIQKGVDAGNVGREELAIPCQNLATIFTALGNTEQAEIYAAKIREITEEAVKDGAAVEE